MKRYRALALQTACRAINGLEPAAARERIMQGIEHIGRQIAASKGFIGPDLKLVVLPEYALTSFPMGESFERWIECACLSPDGPEYEALATVAQRCGVYLAVNAYETDPAFPGLYFQAGVVFSDSGEQVLRYRRLMSMFAPTPHDVWQRYLDHYGEDGVFPVADTPLGRLACIASEEILYPEIARALALRGAEIFLHSTSEVGSPELTPKDICKRARAIENMAVGVSANSAGILDYPIPAQSTDGMSKIVDWQGKVLIEAGFGESMVANAEIDLSALRAWRNRPGMGNLLARQRLELFANTYAGSIHPPNNMLDNGQVQVPERAVFARTQAETLARLRSANIIRGEDDE
ncbi:MAG: hypothetical protein LAT56_12100 [Wenzhouxiangella sp.]|nr:hypothetical protein [Wenzhouxiangella sp.]